jgi:hypothetical protein
MNLSTLLVTRYAVRGEAMHLAIAEPLLLHDRGQAESPAAQRAHLDLVDGCRCRPAYGDRPMQALVNGNGGPLVSIALGGNAPITNAAEAARVYVEIVRNPDVDLHAIRFDHASDIDSPTETIGRSVAALSKPAEEASSVP